MGRFRRIVAAAQRKPRNGSRIGGGFPRLALQTFTVSTTFVSHFGGDIPQGGIVMATKRMFAFAASIFGLALSWVPNALAGCGGFNMPQAHHTGLQLQYGQARLLRTSGAQQGPMSIVGMWHVKFVAQNSPGTPNGAEIDAGYSQWHSDGTETMNSGHFSPQNSNFCLGVWQQVDQCKYKLNHFATYWDATTNVLVGPARVQEQVTLNAAGDAFTGTFTIDQYDEANNLLGHVQGVITGTRMTVDTPAESIF
jgi:hypothetical protein